MMKILQKKKKKKKKKKSTIIAVDRFMIWNCTLWIFFSADCIALDKAMFFIKKILIFYPFLHKHI